MKIKKISKILIANRGEIACRIIRTTKKLGIHSVAVYSEIDKNALHVRQADEAYCIGPAPSQQSYLNQTKIIEIALQAKVNAIHPGYGFLSENAKFAALCEQANLIFIGPSPSAIALMGDKQQSKIVMQSANIPVIPGYQGDEQDLDFLFEEGLKIGFPLMIKASSGGGGKGMRLITLASDLKPGLASAKREAFSSFGNDQLILEKYIEKARHIEIQILCDLHGNFLYLFDRDCSIQRRHQKVIEEAPAIKISKLVKEEMQTTSIRVAKTIGYYNAGTIEFLLDENQKFYFMEMNTRLQVEHPVTEMITGIDIVEEQILIASGEKIKFKQEDIPCYGHAIEARIYAENPEENFTPSVGQLDYLQFPLTNSNIRIETGIEKHNQISVYYDPLIAKLIAWGENRDIAIQTLKKALSETLILGLSTNVAFLYQIINETAFENEEITTLFIEKHKANLLDSQNTLDLEIIMAASLSFWYQQQQLNREKKQSINEKNSPWFFTDGWQLLQKNNIYILFYHQEKLFKTQLIEQNHQLCWSYLTTNYQLQVEFHHNSLQLLWNHQRYTFHFIILGTQLIIFYKGKKYSFNQDYPLVSADENIASKNLLIAPMPGVITKIFVTKGQTISLGEPLIIMEAMKMEHTINAPKTGLIKNIFFHPGDRINQNDVLIELIDNSPLPRPLLEEARE